MALLTAAVFLIFVEVLLQRDSLRLLEKRIELLEKTLRILAATSDSEHAEEEK
jgi:hypothetical protein